MNARVEITNSKAPVVDLKPPKGLPHVDRMIRKVEAKGLEAAQAYMKEQRQKLDEMELVLGYVSWKGIAALGSELADRGRSDAAFVDVVRDAEETRDDYAQRLISLGCRLPTRAR